jgi:multidrug efflux pump subunit AcrA (membrane-fusion protein)
VLGEIATVIIELEKREDVLWLPLAALRTFQGRDFVLIQDGEIQRRVDVQLGLKSQDRVEILDGLSEGQVVIGP